MNAQGKKAISILILLAAAGGSSCWALRMWEHARVFVTTDDAFVKGHVMSVASRIPGPLLSVAVVENQPVNSGQAIATVDPKDYDAALAKAEAGLAEAESATIQSESQIAQARAQVQAALSQNTLAQLDKERFSALFQRNSIPKQRYDQAVTAQTVAAAQEASALQQVSVVQGLQRVNRNRVAVAQAALESARLQRSYCTITAPCDGYVSRKLAEPGNVVAPGQPLLAVVPLAQQGDVWVEANFKETQLQHVHPGQKVLLRADIEDGSTFTGTVDSVAAGTGSVFSLLPPENATGNWVKVVQRVPVKIKLDPGSDPERKLRLGLSVTAEIDTRPNLRSIQP
jgi:membrane fusion protein (multidrug efflux system)